MQIKANLRSLLGNLLAKQPFERPIDRVINRRAVEYIIPDRKILNLQIRPEEPLLRVRAKDSANAKTISNLIDRHKDDLHIRSVHIYDEPAIYRKTPYTQSSVLLCLDPEHFLKSSLRPVEEDPLKHELVKEVLDGNVNGRIVIDFSSPNIAKPFHMGHLKSTLIGNYLANLNTFLGNDVIKLNYVGDWGQQYGLLNLGLMEEGNKLTTMAEGKSALRHLVDVYVKANERGQNDPNYFRKAKELFRNFESDPEQMARWRDIREISLRELKNSYAQLGIEFDVFEFESQYSKVSIEIAKRCETSGLAYSVDGSLEVFVDSPNGSCYRATIQRSDGASLYLTRDIAAAIKRKKEFQFDRMLYIIGADQSKHIHSLKDIIKKLGYNWHNELEHVPFGKILGMSTRSGNYVLLSDIINKAVEEYSELTRRTVTSRAKSEVVIENVGKHMALSALFVYNMTLPRGTSYEFSWEAIMKGDNRSGINLQATYARLCSLTKKAKQEQISCATIDELRVEAVLTTPAMQLLGALNEFDTHLFGSYLRNEPSELVNYAFRLCQAINRARQSKDLWVVGETDLSKAKTRLALFDFARKRLELVIKLLGLKPLEAV